MVDYCVFNRNGIEQKEEILFYTLIPSNHYIAFLTISGIYLWVENSSDIQVSIVPGKSVTIKTNKFFKYYKNDLKSWPYFIDHEDGYWNPCNDLETVYLARGCLWSDC